MSKVVDSQPLVEERATVAVLGATGFAGALAANLAWNHPNLKLVTLTSRSRQGSRLSDLYPNFRVPLELAGLDYDALAKLDAAIVAYPHGASAEVAAELIKRGVKVVDVSADFRLSDPEAYKLWYGEHGAPELLDSAIYGLPELYRDAIKKADLVANPGCYPTATILAMAPLVKEGLVEQVFVDAKSGVSGAGSAATDATHFVNVDENVKPYGVGIYGHRHKPEIEAQLQQLGLKGQLTFVPHLVPLDQGLLSSCYATLVRHIGEIELDQIYSEFYADEPFVEWAREAPTIRDVYASNYCRVHAAEIGQGVVVAFGAIDNLWKGASSQAIQNLNLMLGIDETSGIK